MPILIDLGVICQSCNKEYPDEPNLEEEYTCPCCLTIDTITSLFNQSQNRVNYDMGLGDILVIRENLSIIENILDIASSSSGEMLFRYAFHFCISLYIKNS